MKLCTGYSRLQLVILNFLGNKTPLLNFYIQVFSDWSVILTRIMPNFVKLMRRFRDIVVSLWRRRRRQRARNRFILAKQQLCTCTRFLIFVHFSAVRCTTTTRKCLISRFVEDRNTRQQFSFSFTELWYSPLEFNSKNIWQHLTN